MGQLLWPSMEKQGETYMELGIGLSVTTLIYLLCFGLNRDAKCLLTQRTPTFIPDVSKIQANAMERVQCVCVCVKDTTFFNFCLHNN